MPVCKQRHFNASLRQVTESAQEDPRTAFQRLDELYGQSLTSQDVQALFTFATHLGATILGDLPAVSAFLSRCLEHPALEDESEEMASLQRARMVIALCQRDEDTVTAARAVGIRHPGEEARVRSLAAQTMIARMQFSAATEHFNCAAAALQENEDQQQAAEIGALALNLTGGAQQMLAQVQQTVLQVADLAELSFAGSDRWQNRHQTLHAHGRALEQVVAMRKGRPSGSYRRGTRASAAHVRSARRHA